MGLNVDFMLDPDNEDAHPQNDIRSIIWNLDVLDELAENGGVTSLGEMGLADELDENPEDEDEDEGDDGEDDDEGVSFFPVADGIRTIEFLLAALRATPADPKEQSRLTAMLTSLDEGPELLIEELEEILTGLRMAVKEAQFRFIVV